MTQIYYGNNGEIFHCNVSANHFLGKITLGLWDKVGIPRPLSKDDSLLISRILKNYIKMQKETSSDKAYGAHFWSMNGFAQDDNEDIDFTNEIAQFFERCGGLMTEEEWEDSRRK